MAIDYIIIFNIPIYTNSKFIVYTKSIFMKKVHIEVNFFKSFLF